MTDRVQIIEYRQRISRGRWGRWRKTEGRIWYPSVARAEQRVEALQAIEDDGQTMTPAREYRIQPYGPVRPSVWSPAVYGSNTNPRRRKQHGRGQPQGE
jgi:hypothetical protein